MKNFGRTLGFVGLFILVAACSGKKDEASTSKSQLIPLISSAVNEAMPASLEGAALSLNLEKSPRLGTLTDSTPQEAFIGFFEDSFSGISGVTKTGLINAYLADLDGRITELNNRFDTKPDCMSATPYSWTVTSGPPVNQSITLQVNCLSLFTGTGGDQSGAGSGMAWGESETHYYIALILTQADNTNDKFGYFASYEKDTKAVDLLFLESSDSWSREMVLQLKTNPTGSYPVQATIAGRNLTPGPGQPSGSKTLACGARMIYDGSEILVEGKAGDTDSSGVCQTDISYVFDANKCFSASDITATPANCTTLTTSAFDSGITNFDGTQVFVGRTNIQSALSFSSLSGNVQELN